MAWKENALGLVIDRTMDTDFAALKAQGLSFVILDAGVAYDFNPAFNEQYNKAKAAGLPVLVQFTPISAIDDYTFEAPAQEQIPQLKKVLGTKEINGLIISMERYWVGWDLEQNHQPLRICTGTAISYTASEFVNTFTKQYAPLSVQVMVRTNDNFVQKYSTDLAQWTDKFGFVLADWRYRTRAADGSYSLYTIFPKLTVSALTDLRAALPPDGSKNPLVPGNAPQLKLWEFSGSVTLPVSLVKGWDGKSKVAKAVLFNGNEDAMKAYLCPTVVTPPVDPPADPGDPPVDPGAGTPPTVDLSAVIEALNKVVANTVSIRDDVAAIRADIKSIRDIFRD
jgi:hypothetical protein